MGSIQNSVSTKSGWNLFCLCIHFYHLVDFVPWCLAVVGQLSFLSFEHPKFNLFDCKLSEEGAELVRKALINKIVKVVKLDPFFGR